MVNTFTKNSNFIIVVSVSVTKAFGKTWDTIVMDVRDPKNKDLLRPVHGNVLSFWDAMVVNAHYKCASA